MFITTTLGGLALGISLSVTAGTIAGALVRPRLDRARDRVANTLRRITRRNRLDAEVPTKRSQNLK